MVRVIWCWCPAGRLRMKEKLVLEWWSVPNTSSCSLSVCSMRKKVSRLINLVFSLHLASLFTSTIGKSFFPPVSLGEFVAQFKFTVLLMANGPLRITSGPLEAELYKSEHDVQDPELKVYKTHLFCLHLQ